MTPTILSPILPNAEIRQEVFVQDLQQVKEVAYQDPYHQLEGFQLFAYFTALIIQEDVPFTR